MAKRTNPTRRANDGPRSPALRHLYDRYVRDRPRQHAVYEAHLINAEIARQIYQLRSKAGLSQRALAGLIGTTASVICQLEDADYHGHSLTMLKRIASALNQRLEIRFVPIKKRRRTA